MNIAFNFYAYKVNHHEHFIMTVSVSQSISLGPAWAHKSNLSFGSDQLWAGAAAATFLTKTVVINSG